MNFGKCNLVLWVFCIIKCYLAYFVKIQCNPPTLWVKACRPFFKSSNISNTFFLPFFLSSFLPFFRAPYPRGGMFTSPLAPLLATGSRISFVPGRPRNSFFRCQFSYRFWMTFCSLFDHPKLQK